MKPFVRSAILHDVCRLHHFIRDEDKKELMAYQGPNVSMEYALTMSYLQSVISFTIMHPHWYPVGMFGVNKLDSKKGLVWMVATDDIKLIQKEFLKQSVHWINQLQKVTPYIYNWVDLRNENSHKWLRWCGFKEEVLASQFGYERRPFIKFSKGERPKYGGI